MKAFFFLSKFALKYLILLEFIQLHKAIPFPIFVVVANSDCLCVMQ